MREPRTRAIVFPMLARFMTIILSPLIAAGPALFSPALAEPDNARHAISMHGDPKYGPDFPHLEYVNPDAPKGGTLRLSTLGTFDSLNPFLIRGVPAKGRHLVFETLMARSRDEPFTLYGLLAERIEMPEDRSSITFFLRPEARFQDGQPVTIGDVIFSLETLRDKGLPNHLTYYSQVDRIDRIGDNGVKFTFAKQDGEYDRELPLILGLMPILPRHHFENRDFEAVTLDPIPGSGPYRVDSIDAGRSITYARDPAYWGADLSINRGRFNVDVIRYDYFRDDAIALEAFKAGEIDLRFEPDPQNWARAYDGMGDAVIREAIVHAQPSGMLALAFNTRRDVFTDPSVRKALIHTFDFEWMNDKLFYGAYTRTRSFFDKSELAAALTPSEREWVLLDDLGFDFDEPPAFMEPLSPLPRSDGSGSNRVNLATADALLNEAGWRLVNGVRRNDGGQPFTFEIMLANEVYLRPIQQFARDLERLGIEARVRLIDSAQHQDRANTYDFDMMIYFWGQSLSPGNEQAFYWSSEAADRPGTRNYMGVKDPVLDALIGRITAARERDDLIPAVHLLDRILRSGHYVLPLYHLEAEKVAYHSYVKRPAVSPANGIALDTWWIEPAR